MLVRTSMVQPIHRWKILVVLCLATQTAARSQTPNDRSPVRIAAAKGTSKAEQPVKSAEANQTLRGSEKQSRQPQPCVLLKNDHVLFGQARQLGEWVIVQSGNGGEIKLKRQQVSCWADSIRALYQYRVDHRATDDVRTHLGDAEWCLRYDLLDLAAQEIRSVYAIDPNNLQAKQIEKRLHGRAQGDVNTSTQSHVAKVGFESEVEDDPAFPIDGQSLGRFAGQVQPMLITRCGNCHSHHASDLDEVDWRLFVPTSGTRASAEFTRSNLKATVPYINRFQPAQSPLLTYATSSHGGWNAPLGRRNAKAVQALERWVSQIADRLNSPSRSAPAVEDSSGSLDSILPKIPVDSDSLLDETSVPSGNGPQRLPEVDNPFDPDLFNRRFRMKTNGEKPATSDEQ